MFHQLAMTLWSTIAQAAPALPSIPVPSGDVDIPSWLGAAMASGGILEIAKFFANKSGYKITGSNAVIGSFVVAILVTAARIQIGDVAVLPVDVGGFLPWFYGVLTIALRTTVAANALFVVLYKKALGYVDAPSEPPLPLSAGVK
jgi:preprotein translocase subunit Sec61beta